MQIDFTMEQIFYHLQIKPADLYGKISIFK